MFESLENISLQNLKLPEPRRASPAREAYDRLKASALWNESSRAWVASDGKLAQGLELLVLRHLEPSAARALYEQYAARWPGAARSTSAELCSALAANYFEPAKAQLAFPPLKERLYNHEEERWAETDNPSEFLPRTQLWAALAESYFDSGFAADLYADLCDYWQFAKSHRWDAASRRWTPAAESQAFELGSLDLLQILVELRLDLEAPAHRTAAAAQAFEDLRKLAPDESRIWVYKSDGRDLDERAECRVERQLLALLVELELAAREPAQKPAYGPQREKLPPRRDYAGAT